jgi:hypothetical protein
VTTARLAQAGAVSVGFKRIDERETNMHSGTGTIQRFDLDGTIVTLHLRVRGGKTLVLRGEARMTLDALTAIYEVAPKPAPPMDLIGKRLRYWRDGSLLTSLGAI